MVCRIRISVVTLAMVLLVVSPIFQLTPARGLGPVTPTAATAHLAEEPGGSDQNLLFLPMISDGTQACIQTSPSIFGVQMYGTTKSTSKYYHSLIDSGAHWVRVPAEWYYAEGNNTTPDQFTWWASDLAVATAIGGCHQVILTHSRAPAWAASDPNGPIDKTSLAELTQYVAALVERYDGDGFADAPGAPVVEYFEFYNEPDSGPVQGAEGLTERWGNHGAEYAAMLAAVYPVVKAANPNAKVVFGGIAYDGFAGEDPEPAVFIKNFLDDVLAAGGGNNFDVMNFHTYPAFAGRWTEHGPGLLEKAIAIRAKLAAYGVPDKPLFITEVGWYSNELPSDQSSPEEQARYVLQFFTQSLAADIDATIYWMLHDPSPDIRETGLVTDGTPPLRKKAFTTYQTAVQQLGGVRFVRILAPTETKSSEMQAYQFEDVPNNRLIYVAWLNPIDTTEIESLRVPGSTATVRTHDGNVREMLTADSDGQIKVAVSGDPIYIEIPK